MHSAKLVSIADARQHRDLTVEEAFAAYVEARERMEATKSLEDGIACGKAFKRFLELFVGRF